MSIQDAVERGAARAVSLWKSGDITTRELPEVIVNLAMQEPLLSDYVIGVLGDEFRTRLKQALRSLGTAISETAKVCPTRMLPDRIAEWGEDMDQINSAIFEFIEAEDVLKALEYITMPGCDWSTFTEERRADGN